MKKSHLENLLDVISDLRDRFVLDLGSGRGKFLVELASYNIKAIGLELNQDYIEIALARAKENNVSINIERGVAENLPYKDSTFDFVNMSEVIEHVEEPKRVMSEVFRVLHKGGLVYVSVPNRFGMTDQHFNLDFVNWLPRKFSDRVVYFFEKNIQFVKGIGFQKLSEMHYFTYNQAKNIFEPLGFHVSDIRKIKITRRFKTPLARLIVLFIYRVLRVFYFDSFHFLLKK